MGAGRVIGKGFTYYTLSSRIARNSANATKYEEAAARLRAQAEREEQQLKSPASRGRSHAADLLRQSTNLPEMGLVMTPAERLRSLRSRMQATAARAEKARLEAERLRAVKAARDARKKKK